MGREIRMVPPNWEHPKTTRYGKADSYQPMHDETFAEAAAAWIEGFTKWQAGERPDYFTPSKYPADYQFWEWESTPPDREYYRPYTDAEATWVQLYETVSEGTPLSPPFATSQELVEYLVKNGDFWGDQWSRAGAEAFMRSGWAPSMLVDANGVYDAKDIPLIMEGVRG